MQLLHIIHCFQINCNFPFVAALSCNILSSPRLKCIFLKQKTYDFDFKHPFTFSLLHE